MWVRLAQVVAHPQTSQANAHLSDVAAFSTIAEYKERESALDLGLALQAASSRQSDVRVAGSVSASTAFKAPSVLFRAEPRPSPKDNTQL